MSKKQGKKAGRPGTQDKTADVVDLLAAALSEQIAAGIDREIINGLFDMTEEDNLAILERLYPGVPPREALGRLGLGDTDLRMEPSLLEKIRAARIDSIS